MSDLTKPRRLHRNNKRGPKKSPGTKNRDLYKSVKQIHPLLLKNSIEYILQTADELMVRFSKAGVSRNDYLWHSYGLMHACELIEKFIFDKNNSYRENLFNKEEQNEISDSDSTHSDKL